MKRLQRTLFVFSTLLLLSLATLLLSHAQETAIDKDTATKMQFPANPGPPLVQEPTDFQVRETAVSFINNLSNNCSQLLVNPTLNVLELPGFDSRADPWVETERTVYFNNQDFVSPPHSLFLADADTNDLYDFFHDSFAQAVRMPKNLSAIRFDLFSKTLQANLADAAFLEMWTLNNDGSLNQFIGRFNVPEFANWTPLFLELTDANLMNLLSDKIIGVYFRNETNNLFPGEWVYFDDITLIACTNPQPQNTISYLPAIIKAKDKPLPPAPACTPPLDPPMDNSDTNRGRIDSGAICRTSLSATTDNSDFYLFTPTQNGNYTFQLRNLPAGSNWEVIVYTEAKPRQFVPGLDGKPCATVEPGSGNESVTCSLANNVGGYLVMVNAGSSNVSGNYELVVTRP